MEAKVLSSVGKVAGIAGIGFGVFLFLFKGVLEQKILPEAGLTGSQGFTVIMTLMIMTFGIASIGVIAWLLSRSESKVISATSMTILAALILAVLSMVLFVASRSETPPIGKSDSNAIAPVGRQDDSSERLASTAPMAPPQSSSSSSPSASPSPSKSQIQTSEVAGSSAQEKPKSLQELIAQIGQTADREEKRRLKTEARKLIAEDFRFTDITYTQSSELGRSTDVLSFLDYDPISNVLRIKRKTTGASRPLVSEPWKAVPPVDSVARINIGRLGKLTDYENKAFNVDCNDGGGGCVQYSCTDGNTCRKDEYWYFQFPVGDNLAAVRKVRSAIATVMYKIDGRPAK